MTYVVTTDAWIAPDPPEVKEIQDFDMRMGQKLMAGVDLSALKAQMSQMSQNKCGHGANLRRQARIGGSHGANGERDGKAEGHAGHGGDAHGRKRNWARSSAEFGAGSSGRSTCEFFGFRCRPGSDRYGSPDSRGRSSRLGVFGSALGSSALGAFHRKKAATPPPAAAPAATTTTTTADGTQTTTSAILMETTMQKSNFSQEPVPRLPSRCRRDLRKLSHLLTALRASKQRRESPRGNLWPKH